MTTRRIEDGGYVTEVDRLREISLTETDRVRIAVDREHTKAERPRLPDRRQLRDARTEH
jgi:hypothetical protein